MILRFEPRARDAPQVTPPPYAELVAATNFSFLRGASHPHEMVLRAVELGHAGIAITDRNSVAGVVRAHVALRELRAHGRLPPARRRVGSGPGEELLEARAGGATPGDFHLALGARLTLVDGTPDIVAHVASRAGWASLCRLLTLGNRRAEKGDCILHLADVLAHAEGLLFTLLPAHAPPPPDLLRRLAAAAPTWLAATMPRRGNDRHRLHLLRATAEVARVPLLAVNDALYASPEQRDLQDVLSCIRENVAIDAAGLRLEANAERHLKPAAEMARLFADAPEALAETTRLLARAAFSLDELRYEYPDEPVPPGRDAQSWLEELTWNAARKRYQVSVPARVEAALRHELRLIAQLDYAPYFLTIHDIVAFAQARGILCQGRGSAANSAVCFVLGITAVDPAEHDLLFARFISAERREPPDIDVDFEHERREEVIQHIYEKYGRHRAGIIAIVIHYRPRSALRDAGRALGLTEDVTARLAGLQWGSWGDEIPEAHVREAGLDPNNPVIQRAIGFAQRLLGFPRHLSQHVGGFVLARGRLDEIAPIGNAAMEGRTFLEWDKDDVDALGLMKVDVLALGMLTCIRKAFAMLREHHGIDHDLASIPREDAAVYDMLCRGDSIGVFQVESRAQINMLPRLKPREFYDLVVQVAIVRPGPIQGDMVHPYLRRRAGLEPVEFPSPAPEHGPADELRQVLGRTMGVPLFQEQAMKIAIVAAGFTPDQANGLRRAMATFRNIGTIGEFERLMVQGMIARGYDADFAHRCFEQIKGFGSYGFPESHAASFARLVYVSSWIKCHHPAVFAAALLNSQPMGFYAPAQIIRDAREHGVRVLPVDVNHSDWDNSLEKGALRLGFRQVDGLAEAELRRMIRARGPGFRSAEEVARRGLLPARAMRLLADADGFASLGQGRRAALWAVERIPDAAPLPLFEHAAELAPEADAQLPEMALREEIAADYQSLRLSLKGHPMAMLRGHFQALRVRSAEAVNAMRDGAWVRMAGLVLVRQRPGKGNAVFITLEDESGVVNALLWASLLEQFRRPVMAARLMLAEGRVQRSAEGVVHLMARRVEDHSDALALLSAAHDPVVQMTSADEVRNPRPVHPRHGHPRDARLLPKSRDFH